MLNKFRLGAKFSFILIAVFVLGSVLGYVALSQALQRRAEDEISSRGLALMQAMNAVRQYTSDHIQPLLPTRTDAEGRFVRESIPAFSARSVFANIQKSSHDADLSYREATLDPSNPRDKADAFERDLVSRFRGNRELAEISGFRRLNDQSVFYSARPMRVSNASCLACHGDPGAAPKSMLAMYGRENGFHWTLGDIVAAQVVYVPADRVFASANRALVLMLSIFVAVFALAVGASNVLLRRLVVRPVAAMAAVAAKLGRNELEKDGPEMRRLERVAARGDELGESARVLRTMAGEVRAREQGLVEQVKQLQIEIDQERKTRAVQEVVESDFFRDLKSRAGEMRARHTRTAVAAEPGDG